MKKDIAIPRVKNVHIAVVQQWNDDFTAHDWIVYIINDSDQLLESVMIMSRGLHKDGRKTSTFRHAFQQVEARKALRVELIMEELFAFENEFMLTYFIGSVLYDKVYTAAAFTISNKFIKKLPVVDHQGVLLA
jgi:hypothetical protein